MKPDWRAAPEWAKFLAQDQTGRWHWYERAPIISEGYWAVPQPDSRWDDAEPELDSWEHSLEPRP